MKHQLKNQMKNLSLAAVLLLGGVLSAQADNDVYNNTLKQPRGDAALQVDTNDCSQMLGAPQNGTVTSREYKSCMLSHGWRFSHTVRERVRTTQNDSIPTPTIPA